MKKFLLGVFSIVICIFIYIYAVYFKGFYIDLDPQAPITSSFQIEGKDILIVHDDGKTEKLIIKGVDLPSTAVSHYAADYAIDYDTYMRWFELISDMGANTIRIYTIYNDVFYDAFYDYNIQHEKPLYLLQGLQVSEWANDSKSDAYGNEFYNSLKEDAIQVVDAIHGKLIMGAHQQKGSGFYDKDVSPWVMGYIIGNEWNAKTIAYTNEQHYPASYKGEYISTNDEANAFEAMLADVMDGLISYESHKYKTQRLITFNSTYDTDPFEYDSFYASQMLKFATLDINHFVKEKNYQSGLFASYHLYDYYDRFYQYFSDGQKEVLGEILEHLDTTNLYTTYTSLLNEYHDVPVVISGYSYSSSRGSDSSYGGLNETQQGEALVSAYQDLLKYTSGAFIDSWQDTWEKRMWNTSFAIDLSQNKNWHDIQSESSGYGLLSFVSNHNTINGSMEDWPSSYLIQESENVSLYAFYDEKGIYLYVDGISHLPDDISIPIDVTMNSGTTVDADSKERFERPADFLIQISGSAAKILVHSRYDALRENYLYQIERIDPFAEYPSVDDPHFNDIYMICENRTVIERNHTEEELYEARKNQAYLTGQLIEASEDAGTLADYAFQDDGLELRIPWQMLNFSDPIHAMIHDDYYLYYGVEQLQISEIYLGILKNEQGVIEMASLPLEVNKSYEYEEYLKESYEIVKAYWSDLSW